MKLQSKDGSMVVLLGLSKIVQPAMARLIESPRGQYLVFEYTPEQNFVGCLLSFRLYEDGTTALISVIDTEELQCVSLCPAYTGVNHYQIQYKPALVGQPLTEDLLRQALGIQVAWKQGPLESWSGALYRTGKLRESVLVAEQNRALTKRLEELGYRGM